MDSLKREGPTCLFDCGPISEALIWNILSKQKNRRAFFNFKVLNLFWFKKKETVSIVHETHGCPASLPSPVLVGGFWRRTRNVREKIEGGGKWDYYKMTAMREQYHPQLWWALERYVGADAWVQSSAEKSVTDSHNARDELGQTSHRWRRPTVRCDTKWWVGIRHITMQMMVLRKGLVGPARRGLAKLKNK